MVEGCGCRIGVRWGFRGDAWGAAYDRGCGGMRGVAHCGPIVGYEVVTQNRCSNRVPFRKGDMGECMGQHMSSIAAWGDVWGSTCPQ